MKLVRITDRVRDAVLDLAMYNLRKARHDSLYWRGRDQLEAIRRATTGHGRAAYAVKRALCFRADLMKKRKETCAANKT